MIANANSFACSTTESTAAPSVSILNRIGSSLEITITANTGVMSPISASCPVGPGQGCYSPPSGGTIFCDSTSAPCNVTYSFPDANGDTVSGTFTAPAYGGGSATIDAHTVSGGVFSDITPPTVVSITRGFDGATQIPETTDADTVSWFVVFSEGVTRPQASDFSVTGTTTPVTISDVGADTYEISLASGVGGDIANVNGRVELNFAGGQGITDTAGNALTNTVPSGANDNFFIMQNATVPTVPLNVRQNAAATSLNTISIEWDLPASDGGSPITGYQARYYSDATCSTIITGGNPGLYRGYTVGGLNPGDSISFDVSAQNAVGQSPRSACQVFSTKSDTTPPTLTSIERTTPTDEQTNADSLTWTVTFSEDVVTVDSADFQLTNTTATLSVNPISGSVYEVTASGGDLATLGSGMASGNAVNVEINLRPFRGIKDLAGNDLQSNQPTGTSERSFFVWNEPMSVRDITLSPGINPQYTAASRLTLAWVVILDTADTAFDLTASDISITGTTATPTVTRLFGNTFQIDVTGGDLATVDGPVSISLNSGIQDAFGNVTTNTTPTGTDESTVNVDNVAPVLTLTSTSPDTVTGPFEIRMEFSEPVSNFSLVDLQMTNASRSLTMVDPQTYTAIITPQTDGFVSVVIPQGAAVDGAGNGSNSQVLNRNLDGTAPRVAAIERLNPMTETTNADVLTWRVTFSEPVQNFDPSDLALAATTASLSITGRGDTYEVTASGGNLADLPVGTVSIAVVPTHDIQDTAGNALVNTIPTGPLEVFSVSNRMMEINTITRVDAMTQAPVGELTNADTLAWNIEFGSISGGFSLVPGDFTLSGTTAMVTSVDRYSVGFIVRASGGDLAGLNGNVTLGFSGTNPVDEFGNVFTNKTPSGVNENTYTLDNTAPTLLNVLRGLDGGRNSIPATTDADTVNWLVQFSEDVFFSTSDISVTGTTANVTIPDLVETQHQIILNGGDLPNLNGPISFGFNMGQMIRDRAGNPLFSPFPTGEYENSFNIQNDMTAPTVLITSSASGVISGAFGVSIDFSEDVTGFAQNDIAVGNGSVSSFAADSATSFTATITPTADGQVTVDVEAGAAQDGAGNLSEAAQTFSITNDTSSPIVAVSTPPATVNGPFDLVFSFTEDMTGLTADDFNVTNGTVVLSGGPRDFTVTVTPDGNGDISVDLPANVAFDPAGNGNEAFNATFSVEFDDEPPTVTASTPPASVNGPFDLVFNFSEDMTGLTASDFNVTNGTVVLTGGPRDFTVTITPDGNGDISVDLPANSAFDPAGNGNEAFNATFSVKFDDEPPTVTASTPPASVNGPFDLVFSFTEDMSGLTASDFNVTNGTVVLTGGPRDFTVTITPDGNGDISVGLPANSAFDPAGNGNEAFEATIEVTVDQTAPTVSLSTDSSDVTGPFTVVMTFSEAVEGFEEGDVEVSNGTLSGFAGEGTSYSVLVTPETLGAVTLSIADGAAQDAAGNALVGDSLGVSATGGDVEVELAVTTTTGSAGDVGSAFTLSNPGTTPISFTASADQPWVDVTPSSGQIGSLGDLEFTITLNDQVDDLPAGTYVATVTVVIDDPAAGTAQAKASGSTDGLVLATVPVTVEVEERFGAFELVILSPTGLSNGSAFSYASDIPQIDGLSVPANVGESRTRIDELLNGSYEITQSVPEGWRLESVSCTGDLDGGTVVDPTTGKINVDLDAGETLSCIFENARDDDAIRLATQRAIRNFMARRGDRLLETAPDLSTRFTERGSTEGGSFSANGTALRTQMDFRTSLSGFRNRAAASAVGDNKDLMAPVMEGWDMWVSAEYSRVEDERVGSGIDAKFFAAQFGIDYQVKDNLILGGLVQYDWMSEEDEELAQGVGAVAGAQVEGDGFMVGPYGVWQVSDTLVLDAMGLWGTSDNTVNPLGYYEDAFETTRFLLRANATGQFAHGPWTIRPQLTWSHYEDEQDAYIDSLGIDIPSQRVTIGRLRAGPELLWTHAKEGGAQIQLGGAIRANWDYDGPGLLDQTGRLSDGGSSLRADGDLLLGLRLTNGLSLRAKVGIDGIGKGKFDARSGRLELSFPFGGAGGAGTGVGNNPAFDALNMAWTSGNLDQTGLGNDTLASRRHDPLEQFMRGANSNF